ncbi:MAG: hypothetical protein KIT00_10095 [Rhodospirillales bacterium]|nr:hypothetical protein [Rhodospirillales bacterium]
MAKDIATGSFGPGSQDAFSYLENNLELLVDLVDLLIAEGRKKKQRTNLISAFAIMLGHGLDEVRLQVEAGIKANNRVVDRIRRNLLKAGSDEKLDPAVLMIILGQFSIAKLEVGEELRELLSQRMDDAADFAENDGDVDMIMDAPFAELVKAVNGDLFELQSHVVENTDAFPAEHRAGMAVAMLQSKEPLVREAAIGGFLDQDSMVRVALAESIERLSPPPVVSGTMLRRMIALRNWLPSDERPKLDAAIKSCRQRKVECASWPRTQVADVYATGIDGSGAQSIFVMAKERRKYAFAALLVKQGVGVRDAWVRHRLTRREVDAFQSELPMSVDIFESSMDHVRALMSHYLAVAVESGTMPPFELFDFAETTGLDDLNPVKMEVEQLVQSLCEDIESDFLEPQQVKETLENCDDWLDNYMFMESWFEGDDDIAAQLQDGAVNPGDEEQFILEHILPPRRKRWAEMMAWTALTLKQDEDDPMWETFAVTARELLTDRDIGEFAVMRQIAADTVKALRFNKARFPLTEDEDDL